MTLDPIHMFRLLIAILLIAVLGEAAVSKIRDRGVPDWFRAQFQKTWMGRLPLGPMWWAIAAAELAVALLAIGAIANGSLFAPPSPPLLEWALLGAMAVFIALCFGLRVSMDFVGAANAFFYAALSGLLFATMRMLSSGGGP